MRRDYYLHKRKNGIYYVEFNDKVSGKKLSAKSTGETDEIQAKVKVELWKQYGIPTGKKKELRSIDETAEIETVIKILRKANFNADDAMRIVQTLKNIGLIDIAAVKNTGAGAVKFIDYIKEFWDYDRSEYIKNRLSHGKKIGRTHTHLCMLYVKSVMIGFFGDKKLNCVTTDDLQKLTNNLYERGLATSTIIHILLCAETPLKWAYKHNIIPSDPCIGLEKFAIVHKERGILTELEAAEVLHLEHWRDKRAFVASFISFTTGARLGEILALRPSSIKNDLLSITNSYSRLDGLKCPKNTKKRLVPLYPYVKQCLLNLLTNNPNKESEDPFFFYSSRTDKPCSCDILQRGLREVLRKLGIDWRARNISFHSWRHMFITYANMEADAKKVMKISGHLSDEVFKRYANHVDENDIREVGMIMGKVFDNILQIPKVSILPVWQQALPLQDFGQCSP